MSCQSSRDTVLTLTSIFCAQATDWRSVLALAEGARSGTTPCDWIPPALTVSSPACRHSAAQSSVTARRSTSACSVTPCTTRAIVCTEQQHGLTQSIYVTNWQLSKTNALTPVLSRDHRCAWSHCVGHLPRGSGWRR